jgi:hypothetical protein
VSLPNTTHKHSMEKDMAKIEIEDGQVVGYDIIGFRQVSTGELYVDSYGTIGVWESPATHTSTCLYLILRKKKEWVNAEMSHLPSCPRPARFRDNPNGEWVDGELWGWWKTTPSDEYPWKSSSHASFKYCQVEE